MTVHTLFFSPTHSSRHLARRAGKTLAAALACQEREHSWTSPAGRAKALPLQAGDILLLAFPVYGGRIPALLEEAVGRLAGEGVQAVLLAVYGNRHYDDALLEMGDLLAKRGCQVVAAAALVAQHSLTDKVATGRPDADDLAALDNFMAKVAEKLATGHAAPVALPGQRPYKERKPAGDIRPVTDASCTRCQICVKGCPAGVISADDPARISAGCLRCHACVKFCPVQAKHFDNENLLKVAAWLEANCSARREPEFFLEAAGAKGSAQQGVGRP